LDIIQAYSCKDGNLSKFLRINKNFVSKAIAATAATTAATTTTTTTTTTMLLET
jgi:hypothetical protein